MVNVSWKPSDSTVLTGEMSIEINYGNGAIEIGALYDENILPRLNLAVDLALSGCLHRKDQVRVKESVTNDL